MSFILIIKKRAVDLNKHLDFNYLNSNDAPTYPAESLRKIENSHYTFFHYEHGSAVSKDSVINDDTGLYLIEGTAFDLATRKNDAKSIYKRLSESRNTNDVQGDFLVLGIDHNGNGEFFNTLMSFNRLFQYSTDDYYIFSSEVALIFNCLEKFKSKSVPHFFNHAFIADTIRNEWSDRKYPLTTMIEGIERVPTTTFVKLKSWSVDYEDQQYNLFDKDLEQIYMEDKKKFYDFIFEIIRDANSKFLDNILDDEIEVLMSGGLDSRLNVAILENLADVKKIKLKAKCFGPSDHPDVVIGKRISEELNLPFENAHDDGKLYYPQSIEEYKNCIKISQGDWNSNNFRTSKTFVKRIVVSGQDNYKRHNWAKIFAMNRWYAARMTYTKTLPILSLPIINKTSLIYGKHAFHEGLFEFAYELLKRFNPVLLDIPLVGMSIPQHFVEPYSTVAASKTMPSQEAKAYYEPALVEEILLKENSSIYSEEFNISLDLISENERFRRIAMDFSSLKGEFSF